MPYQGHTQVSVNGNGSLSSDELLDEEALPI
jgi:hypothetical protein